MQIFNAVSNYRNLYAENGKVLESHASSASHQQGSSGNEANARITTPGSQQRSASHADTDRVTISEAARLAAQAAESESARQADDASNSGDGVSLSLAAAAQLLAWSASAQAESPQVRRALGTSTDASSSGDAAALSRSDAALKAINEGKQTDYLRRLQAHYESALTDAGIAANAVYLNPMTLDRTISDRVRRSMTARINGDPALQSLRAAIE